MSPSSDLRFAARLLLDGPPTLLHSSLASIPDLRAALLEEIRGVEEESVANPPVNGGGAGGEASCCGGVLRIPDLVEALNIGADPILFRKEILLVEDEELISMLVERALTARGARVTVCSSVKSAKAIILDSSFHVVVSDIALTDGTGFEVYEALKQKSNGTTPEIVFATGFGYDPSHVLVNVSADLKASGAHDALVLYKPFSLENLASTLHQAIERRSFGNSAA